MHSLFICDRNWANECEENPSDQIFFSIYLVRFRLLYLLFFCYSTKYRNQQQITSFSKNTNTKDKERQKKWVELFVFLGTSPNVWKDLICSDSLVEFQWTISTGTGQIIRVAAKSNTCCWCSVIVENFKKIPLFWLINSEEEKRMIFCLKMFMSKTVVSFHLPNVSSSNTEIHSTLIKDEIVDLRKIFKLKNPEEKKKRRKIYFVSIFERNRFEIFQFT